MASVDDAVEVDIGRAWKRAGTSLDDNLVENLDFKRDLEDVDRIRVWKGEY